MKADELMDMIGEVDDEFVEESKKGKKPAGRGMLWIAAAACLALIVIGSATTLASTIKEKAQNTTSSGNETDTTAASTEAEKSEKEIFREEGLAFYEEVLKKAVVMVNGLEAVPFTASEENPGQMWDYLMTMDESTLSGEEKSVRFQFVSLYWKIQQPNANEEKVLEEVGHGVSLSKAVSEEDRELLFRMAEKNFRESMGSDSPLSAMMAFDYRFYTEMFTPIYLNAKNESEGKLAIVILIPENEADPIWQVAFYREKAENEWEITNYGK